jgi:hypothetical protein
MYGEVHLHRSLGLVLVCLLLPLAGCGSDYPVAPVSGQVTLDEMPLPDASVTFQPVTEGEAIESALGAGSYGKTDAEGRYSLKLIENDRQGAAVGKHKVQISVAVDDPDSDAGPGLVADKVPSRYRGADTKLSFEVSAAGTDQADFALTTQR